MHLQNIFGQNTTLLTQVLGSNQCTVYFKIFNDRKMVKRNLFSSSFSPKRLFESARKFEQYKNSLGRDANLRRNAWQNLMSQRGCTTESEGLLDLGDTVFFNDSSLLILFKSIRAK